MIKRTYFFSGYDKESESVEYGAITWKTWFPKPHDVMDKLMERFPDVRLERFHRIK